MDVVEENTTVDGEYPGTMGFFTIDGEEKPAWCLLNVIRESERAKILLSDEVYNFPNPAKGNSTTIRFILTEEANMTIKIYNTAGKLVKTFKMKGTKGRNTQSWEVSNVANGVYFYKITAKSNSGKDEVTKKLAILK